MLDLESIPGMPGVRCEYPPLWDDSPSQVTRHTHTCTATPTQSLQSSYKYVNERWEEKGEPLVNKHERGENTIVTETWVQDWSPWSCEQHYPQCCPGSTYCILFIRSKQTRRLKLQICYSPKKKGMLVINGQKLPVKRNSEWLELRVEISVRFELKFMFLTSLYVNCQCEQGMNGWSWINNALKLSICIIN